MKMVIAWLLLAGGISLPLVAPTAASDVFDASPKLRACAAGMIGGFGSGLDERACKNYFILPSNYHFACARGVWGGFDSAADRAACVAFFEGQVAAAKAAYVKPEHQ